MKSGAFLKENKTERRQPAASTAPAATVPAAQRRRPPTRRYHRSRADRQRRLMMILIGILSAILIGCVILLFSLGKGSSPLEGTWDIDGVTFYRFDNKSSGALVLPSTEYTFKYTARNGVLSIDFEYEGAKDAEYKYVLDGDTLTLDGGTDTTKNLYVLKKLDVNE